MTLFPLEIQVDVHLGFHHNEMERRQPNPYKCHGACGPKRRAKTNRCPLRLQNAFSHSPAPMARMVATHTSRVRSSRLIPSQCEMLNLDVFMSASKRTE